MKAAIIYNKGIADENSVINVFGMQNREVYKPQVVERVAKSLEKGGHKVKVIDGNMHLVDNLKSFMPKVMLGERPGIVFNMAYGIQGESRYTHIPSMLEMLGIPYVGSGPSAHAIALDKVLSKIMFLKHGLPTPDYWVFDKLTDEIDDVTYPSIVKPKMESVSMGLKVVYNKDELIDAVSFIINEYNQAALVERFIAGREFAVGLLGNGNNIEVLPIVEIDLGGNKNQIQTLDNKLNAPMEKICPADLPEAKAEELRDLAKRAYNAIGLKDFSRVDFRMDDEGNPYILEINSMASLGITGSYVLAAKKAKYNFEALVNKMLDSAIVRYFGEEALSGDTEKADGKPVLSKLNTYVRSKLDDTLANLKKMVDMETYVYDANDVNKLGKWISSKLKNLGFEAEIYEMDEVGNTLYFKNHNDERNDVLLLSHLDTSFKHDDFVQYEVKKENIYGSGTAENKGGLAVMLAALNALKHIKQLDGIKCGILLTTDDTLGGKYSKKIIHAISAESDYTIGLKYGDLDGSVITSRAGTVSYNWEISNRKTADTNEVNSIYKFLSRKISAIEKIGDNENTLVTIKAINAQSHFTASPDYANVSFTFRYKQRLTHDELTNIIKKLASVSDKNIKLTVKRGNELAPMNTPDDLLAAINNIETTLEYKIPFNHRWYSSNICHVAETTKAVDGLGPLGDNFRSKEEYILRESILDRIVLLSMLLKECGGN